jgi:hypothetical protein
MYILTIKKITTTKNIQRKKNLYYFIITEKTKKTVESVAL